MPAGLSQMMPLLLLWCDAVVHSAAPSQLHRAAPLPAALQCRPASVSLPGLCGGSSRQAARASPEWEGPTRAATGAAASVGLWLLLPGCKAVLPGTGAISAGCSTPCSRSTQPAPGGPRLVGKGLESHELLDMPQALPAGHGGRGRAGHDMLRARELNAGSLVTMNRSGILAITA